MDGFRRLIGELHRRSIWQVLAIYLAGSWIALQVVETLAETLDLPEWAPGLAFTLLVVGLPIVLATAFVQEGRGLGGEDDGGSEADATDDGPVTGAPAADPNLALGSQESLEAALSLFTWRNAVAGGIAAFALWGILSAGWLFFGPGFGSEEVYGTVEGGSAAATGAGQTIAVLPFENMSGTTEAEPFTVGIHDDILTQLSKISALQVTSRTSVLDYRDSTKPIREIADELGVKSILEGGVQTAPNRVRINVQLIDAESDRHLWAETYDRELTAENVFEIQSEIARNVAEALRAELAPEEEAAIAAIPTTDLDALALYHRGRELFADRTDPQSAAGAESALEGAVEADSEFAAAWAELTKARSWLLGVGTADEAGVQEALQRTKELAPGSFEAEMAEGYFLYYGRREMESALERFDAAARLRPTDTDAIQARALILRRLSSWDEAVTAFEQAAALDPRNSDVLRLKAETLGMMRRFDESLAVFAQALELDPSNVLLSADYAEYAISAGDTALAATIVRENGLDERPEAWLVNQQLAWARKDFEAALSFANGAPPSQVPLYRALVLAMRGLGNRRIGNEVRSQAAGDSLLVMMESFSIPSPAWREAFVSIALLSKGRTDEAQAVARDCLEIVDPEHDALDDVNATTLCLAQLGEAGDRDEAIDGLIRIANRPNRDLSSGRLAHAPAFRDVLGDHPRFPELEAKLQEVERAAQGH